MSFQKHPLTAQLLSALADAQQPERVYKVNATSKNINQIHPSIKNYSRIRCLMLDFNYIQLIENLNPLFDLRQFHAEGNLLTQIGGLETCKNLIVLNLSANKIEKIQKLGHLGKLQVLNLSKNRLSKINNLESLKQLKTLNLSNNSISSLDSLPAFSKLQTLLLNNNKISKISTTTFNNSSKLVRLDLSNNQLRDCNFISKLVSLEYLNLGQNLLENFFLQNPLKYLEELVLAGNQLESLPPVGQFFPELVTLDVCSNMFCSQHEFITLLSQNQMLTELYFRENPIHTKTFQNTLYELFKFDRINDTTFQQPGTKYLTSISQIQKQFHTQFKGLEDDQDDRRIKMSGFYNDGLENRMTGIKPHRAVSPATKKAKALLSQNFDDIQKSFQEFMINDKRITSLREMYQKICEENNIQKPQIQPLKQQENANQFYLTEQANLHQRLSDEQKRLQQLRLRHDNNQKIMQQTKISKEAKWAELKARTKEKNFNIRKSRTKDMNSSLSKFNNEIPKSKISVDLMRTQLNPHRPLVSAGLQSANKTGKSFYRPSSQRKSSKKL